MKKCWVISGVSFFLIIATICLAAKKNLKEEIAQVTQIVLLGEGKDAASRQQKKDRIPAIINSPSTAGEVSFPHQEHFEEFEFECETCHHETNATELKFPHEDYFNDFWIDCTICHHKGGTTILVAQACSKCHHDSPANIADETLSSKVVIHKSCWECHEVDKGQEASRNCKFCHSGPKSKF